jgi:hypothetical protein
VNTIIVRLPESPDQDQRLLELAPGQEATFGRGTEDRLVDIPLADPGVSRLAGRIRAVEDFWLLSNLSRETTYAVENPEGGGEFIKVPPRRLGVPVPFEFARVTIPAEQRIVSFQVFAPQHTYAEADAIEVPGGDETLGVFPLDETSKYFLILVALCEPQLRNSPSVMIPTVNQIVDRLSILESCRALTREAVHFHIEYLATQKLRVKPSSFDAGSPKANWQRAALVSLALRFNLVREDHLALLPSRLQRQCAITEAGSTAGRAGGRT